MLSTPATIVFLVFLGFLIWGMFLVVSLFRITKAPNIAQAREVRQKAIFNLLAMFGFFIVVVFALFAITEGWGTTMPTRWLYAFLLVFHGLGFTVPFLAQFSLWARCKAMTSARAAPHMVG